MVVLRNIDNIIYYVLFLLFIGTFYPFVHNYIIFEDKKIHVTVASLVIWSVIVIYRKKNRFILPSRSFNIILVIQGTYFFIWSIILSSQSIANYGVRLVIGWYILVLILNSFNNDLFIKTFIKINIASLILSIIGLFIVLSGLSGVISVHSYHGNTEIYNYIFFFVKRPELSDFNIRVAGYYDEPGSLAFIVVFLLLINKKYYKNMKWEYSLLLLPLITTSLAHIFTVVLFLSTYYINKENIRKLFYLLSILLLVISSIIRIEDNEYLDYFKYRTIDRIANFSGLESDKGRGDGFELGPELFKKYPLGISPEKIRKLYPTYVHEVVWSPVLYFGITGYLIYIMLFMYIFIKSIKNKDRTTFIALVILSANMIQRPNYIYPIYIVLLYFLFFDKKNFNP